MSHQFTVDCKDNTRKFIAIHNWVVSQGWVIKVDYDWTTEIGYRDDRKIIIKIHDPQKAMLFKLTWV